MKNLNLIAGTLTLAAASMAMAAPVTLDQNGVGSGSTVRIYNDGDWRNVFAGQIRHAISGAVGLESWMNGTQLTYCADLAQVTSGSPITFNTTSIANLSASDPMGAIKANAIRDMFVFASGAQISTTASNDFATAFQLAIWEVINDFDASESNSGLSVTSGDFRAKKTDGSALSSGIATHLNALFGAAGDNLGTAGLNIAGLSSQTNQDQIVSGVMVPTPGALALVTCGGLVALRRRRK